MPTDTHIAPLPSVNKGKVHWLFSVQYLMQNLWQAVYSTNHTQLAWSVTLGDRQYNVAMEPLPVCCRHAKQLLCQRSEHNYDKLKSEKKQRNSSINTAIGHKMSHRHGSDIRTTLGSIVGLNHVDIQKTITNFIFVSYQTVLKHLQNHYWWKTASLIQRIMNV